MRDISETIEICSSRTGEKGAGRKTALSTSRNTVWSCTLSNSNSSMLVTQCEESGELKIPNFAFNNSKFRVYIERGRFSFSDCSPSAADIANMASLPFPTSAFLSHAAPHFQYVREYNK